MLTYADVCEQWASSCFLFFLLIRMFENAAGALFVLEDVWGIEADNWQKQVFKALCRLFYTGSIKALFWKMSGVLRLTIGTSRLIIFFKKLLAGENARDGNGAEIDGVCRHWTRMRALRRKSRRIRMLTYAMLASRMLTSLQC